MGREIKRVPLDFDHEGIWPGFINPYYKECARCVFYGNECPHCKGEGIDPEYLERYEMWEPTEPPTGEGWQVWETVTEGSPDSPVFEAADEVVAWLIEGGYNPDGARLFVEEGWAPSLAFIPGKGVMKGIDALPELLPEDDNV